MSDKETMWVEVEMTWKEWRQSYGVTSQDALENVGLDAGERTTGRVKREYELKGQE